MTSTDAIKRILVIRIDFLGDMLCTTAFLHALKRRWPDAELHVLANKYNRAALAGNPDVTAVHSYVYSKQFERNERPGFMAALVSRFALIRRLRRLRFDLLIVPNGGMHKNSIRFAQQLGAKDCRWHDVHTEFDDRKPEHVAQRPMRHEALSGFRLVPELPWPDEDALRLFVQPDGARRVHWRREFGPKARPRIGLFVSNRSAERRWHPSKWRLLAAALHSRADVIVFQDPAGSSSGDDWRDMPVHCATPASVADMVAAASELDLIVSADSAPVHLASALRLPVVALFENRPEKYLRWFPLGTRHVIVRAERIVDDIGVDAVEAAIAGLVDENGQVSDGASSTAAA
ncbi:glycosyltransferase family 9 protein [Burkholderia ubonensis]|uniref:Glycosyl transferase n=1 Tax=Burkholderia ubonensis subsp. mesacidophila TaxID=265293 RepID=A0A2A4FHF6_9BURK|nr:glycosyltransferase family 9 protein [Burkholderia ubonensis]PCE32100.1 glycosyl transferase [Burkholderia ubonensis subsp. mesacidophila]